MCHYSCCPTERYYLGDANHYLAVLGKVGACSGHTTRHDVQGDTHHAQTLELCLKVRRNNGGEKIRVPPRSD